MLLWEKIPHFVLIYFPGKLKMFLFKIKMKLLVLGMVSFFIAGCSSLNTPQGTYAGTIWSGERVPVFTTFYPQPLGDKKQIYGTFIYQEKDYWVTGSLSDCQFHPDQQILCHWHDKYGSGVMKVRFDNNFESFEGNWGTYCGIAPDASYLIWNGKRVSSREKTASDKPEEVTSIIK